MKAKPSAKGRRSRFHHAAAGQIREAVRVPVKCHVSYSGVTDNAPFISEGTMTDLSGDGWGIRGEHPVQPGMVLTLWLYHPDNKESFLVDEVTVSWAKGHRFGLHSVRTVKGEGMQSVGM